MDFIYSRLNNNLVDINRIKDITLLKCEEKDDPIEGLRIGDYYLKVTVVDSDRVVYSDFSNINKDEEELLDRIYQEQQRATGRENEIESNSGNHLSIEQDEQTGIVTISLLNIHDEVLDTKTLDLETEKIIRDITLDYEHKKLVFDLVDGTTIECDISDMIDDLNEKLSVLTTNLNSEITRAEGEEQRIESKAESLVEAEEERAEGEEQRIETKAENLVTAEETRATTAEQTLQSNIDTEATTRSNADTTLSNLLTAETNRATGAENTLDLKIDQEIQDRISDVNTEETRAKEVETALNTAISTETTRATDAESALNTRVDNEITNRSNADTELSNRITAEFTRATSAEQTLDSKIDQEILDRQNAITSEATTRSNADTALDNKITTETERAEGVEYTLQSNINSEASTRESADQTLQSNIDNEASARQSADETLQSNIEDEEERALSAEESLRNKLTRYFDKFVDGENIDTQFNNGQKVYCHSGTVMEGGDVPSTTIINFTQTANKALYIKNIYIKYLTPENDEIEYNYSFDAKVFDANGQTQDLGGISWILFDSNSVSYFGYNNNYGQQVGSSSKGIRNCTLTTSDFAGCTVKEVRITACGASGTGCKVGVTVGNDIWLYDEGGEQETSAYPLPANDISSDILFTYQDGSTPGAGTIVTYTETFLTKENDEIITIEPEQEIVYINFDDRRIYLYDGTTLIEISKVLELGTTSTTAYRGDWGNSNRSNIQNILNSDITFRGQKTFADDIWLEYEKTLYTDFIRSQNEDGGYETLAEYNGDAYSWKLGGISKIDTNLISMPFMQTEDSSNPGSYDPSADADSIRIMNIAEPINQTDGANKDYVDNSVSDVSDSLSADISSEASRASQAESALQGAINSETTARENADTGLSGRIGTLETLVDPGSDNTLAGLVFEEL